MNKVFKNSFWGVVSLILQNLFYSLFFIIIARKYSTEDFSNYILANTLYGFILSFSTLGLGQWFVRTIKTSQDQGLLIYTFFKIQIIIGCVFYILNILFSFILYDSIVLHRLVYIVGINIILDNIIYVVKYINIAFQEQKRTFIITTIESIIKFAFGVLVIYVDFSIVGMTSFLILFRFFTLLLFLNRGTMHKFNLSKIFNASIDHKVIQTIILSNWPFIIIGSVSIVYWKVGNIILSKMLPLVNVAIYEISFKMFAIAEAIPVIVSTTIFPVLLDKIESNIKGSLEYFKMFYYLFLFYGLFCYTFIYCFSSYILPFIFGTKYPSIIPNTVQMFATMIIFPGALLQANFIVALKREKIDMVINVISLFCHIIISLLGVYIFKSLAIINFSTFLSFCIFHVLQDIYFIKNKVFRFQAILSHYFYLLLVITLFYFLSFYFTNTLLFIYFWILIMFIVFLLIYRKDKFVTLKNYIKFN